MKITHVSSTQFAGLRDCDISLKDGLNVIYGKNESGKSTLVNLIARTLFQDAKLKRNVGKDTNFIDSFFPSSKKEDSKTADFIDGEITLETEGGVYKLSKEWSRGTGSNGTLRTPDDVFHDSASIAAALKEVLVYGEGVYADVLLSSQRNADASLQTILNATRSEGAARSEAENEKARREIADAVSEAFAESGSISVDAIGQAIQAKIDGIAGKHWDEEQNIPFRTRQAGSRWQKDLGTILEAYYKYKDAEGKLEELSGLEREADRASAEYAEKDAAFRTAERKCERFRKFSGSLAVRREREKRISSLHSELKYAVDALSRWPDAERSVKRARELEKERRDREKLDLYSAAKPLHEELDALKAQAAAMCCPADREIQDVRKAQRRIAALEGQLCGMNLSAEIKLLGDHGIEIRSLRTGETIGFSGHLTITEAVKVTIPGVAEMILSPADVDAASVRAQIAAQQEQIDPVFEKYNVQIPEDLETLSRNYNELQKKITDQSANLKIKLGGAAYETVASEAGTAADAPRSRNDIDAEIASLCGDREIGSFIDAKEDELKRYENDYTDIPALKEKVLGLKKELEQAEKTLAETEEIPPEFKEIADPEEHQKRLESHYRQSRDEREQALHKKAGAVSRLETYRDETSGDLEDNVKKAEREFEEQKALLAHWRHIEKVFEQEKAKIHDNPLSDLAENFTRYLARISDDRVVSEFPAPDRLDMDLYSAGRRVDYGKLSEGTKETVSLAFRLAVLDHLFPEGGGIAVLDDPFANMDADRAARSVELVRDFAKRHQVIFLTCKEEYRDLSGGNFIEMKAREVTVQTVTKRVFSQ